jgi:hypothetical protein
MNGAYKVENQRYVMEDGSASDYLSLNATLADGPYSPQLCAFIEEWSGELSYGKLSRLLTQVTGTEVLTASGIQSYLERKAERISASWASDSLGIETIAVCPEVPIYDPCCGEVVLMLDDVCVKAQKPHKNVARDDRDAKRHDTTVILVSDSKGDYHCATEGIDKSGRTVYSAKSAIADTLAKHHDLSRPLPVVAVTDGARSIRILLYALFGESVRIILDWYHLQLKVKNLMSMIARNKDDKDLYINDLKALLWVGNAAEAMIYIDNIGWVKSEDKRKELRGYLEKHQAEIIDYSRRQAANKAIGSGRVEKANDTVVAHRQKKKGMSWSRTGSSSLAIVNVNRMNLERAA